MHSIQVANRCTEGDSFQYQVVKPNINEKEPTPKWKLRRGTIPLLKVYIRGGIDLRLEFV